MTTPYPSGPGNDPWAAPAHPGDIVPKHAGQPASSEPVPGQQLPGQQLPGQHAPAQPAHQQSVSGGSAPHDPWQGAGPLAPTSPGGPGYGPGSSYPPVAPFPPLLADGMQLASVWKRVGATVLDQLALLIALLPLVAVLVILQFAGLALVASAPAIGDNEAAAGASMGVVVLISILVYILMFVYSLGLTYWYFIHRVRKTGATLGKQMLGLRIRSIAADGQLTWGQVWGRYLTASLLSSFTGGVGAFVDILWCFWDERRQCLHDKAVGTVVIDEGLQIVPATHPDVQRVRATPFPKGWVADGPSPVTPPTYPRHPQLRTY